VNYENLLTTALKELSAAVKKMTAETVPATPMPRPKVFIICGKYCWPHIINEMDINWLYVTFNKTFSLTPDFWCHIADHPRRIAHTILLEEDYQPRFILRALRRLQAATAWCEARAEGRKRQAKEILRQQKKAVEALEAEAAMLALK